MNTIKVKAIFQAILSEGKMAGLNVVYVVLDGEDNNYTFAGSLVKDDKPMELTPEEIVQIIDKYKTNKVAIVGGEPIKNNHVYDLILTLRDKYVIIETKAMHLPDRTMLEKVNHWIISPELVSSEKHIVERIDYDILTEFLNKTNDPLVFKILNRKDMKEVLFLQDQLKIPSHRITLMARDKSQQGIIAKNQRLMEWCKEYGFNFSPRLHVMVYKTPLIFRHNNT